VPILRWSTEEFAEAAKGVERQRVVTELIWPIWMLSSPLSSIARFNGQCDPYTSLLCIGERGASICTTEYSDQHAGRHVQAGSCGFRKSSAIMSGAGRRCATLRQPLSGLSSGSILMWETDEPIPTRNFAVAQDTNAFAGRKLLLDGQQRLTSLTAVLSGEP